MMAAPDSDASANKGGVQPSAPVGRNGVLSAGSARSSSVSDKAADEDLLGFKDYVDAIARFLKAPDTEAPLTLSIEGEWGSGKSSFLLQLKKALEAAPAPAVVIPFNAWRYDKQDELWAAFALHVTRGLRNGVSLWRRYWGDLRLFFSRIKGVVGWLNVLGFLLLWAILLGAVGSLLFWSLHADVKARADAIAALLPHKAAAAVAKAGSAPEQPGLVAFALRHGPWAGSLALLFAACSHLGTSIRKRLLDFRLERFLDRPDYQGHAAFLEAFHDDFAKTLDAYVGSGPQKVYVLVDDLDRCDVPKAAELMQAINLMIGENRHLVFILAMDREKVASGIAYKYKDVLPYLAEFAPPVSAAPPTSAGSAVAAPTPSIEDRLAFGHAFLEKFIQLSFRIPATDDEAQLRGLLEGLRPRPPVRRLSLDARLGVLERQVWGVLVARLSRVWRGRVGLAEADPGDAAGSSGADTPGAPASPQSFIEFCRMTTGDESPDVVQVVLMVKDVFRGNPRRIKLFLNAFRLSFYLASAQGLFDRSPGSGTQPITIDQLGKFLALGMRCPALYKNLTDEPGLLCNYEQKAIKGATAQPGVITLPDWLERSGVQELLRYGVVGWGIPYDPARYSLADFPVARLLRVMRFAAAPPLPSGGASAVLEGLIADLEAHLTRPHRERSPRLAKVVARAIEEDCVEELIAKHTSGSIIDIVVALGVVTAVVTTAAEYTPPGGEGAGDFLSLALVYLQYRRPGAVDLIQHQALQLSQALVWRNLLSPEGQRQLSAVIRSEMDGFERGGSPEKNRYKLAKAILGQLSPTESWFRPRSSAPVQVVQAEGEASGAQAVGATEELSSGASSAASFSDGAAPSSSAPPSASTRSSQQRLRRTFDPEAGPGLAEAQVNFEADGSKGDAAGPAPESSRSRPGSGYSSSLAPDTEPTEFSDSSESSRYDPPA